MFDPKVKLEKAMYEKVKEVSESLGVSVEEFVSRAIASELERIAMEGSSEADAGADEARAARQMKGLGYIE
jgi:hypothetical protein